jgi:hypothetical protein
LNIEFPGCKNMPSEPRQRTNSNADDSQVVGIFPLSKPWVDFYAIEYLLPDVLYHRVLEHSKRAIGTALANFGMPFEHMVQSPRISDIDGYAAINPGLH